MSNYSQRSLGESAKKADKADKRAKEETEKQAEEKIARKEAIRKAIRDSSSLIIRDGPFANLGSLDQEQLANLRNDVVAVLRECEEQKDYETLSKSFRVFFTLPIKYDAARLPSSD